MWWEKSRETESERLFSIGLPPIDRLDSNQAIGKSNMKEKQQEQKCNLFIDDMAVGRELWNYYRVKRQQS